MENIRIGYKAVLKHSLRSFAIPARVSVKYEVNTWVSPCYGCGPLCVFDTLQDALHFVGKDDSISIYECIYEKSKQNKIYYISSGEFSHKRPLVKLPKGTVLANKVKLVKRAK